ncbi:hypothetical protein FRC17_007433 [Serendipita sp. 399]|nr:hypothetical protein FRC17_007433 [Serendipita sp. 399]
MAVIIALAIVTYFKLIEHMSYNPYVRSCVPASNPKIMMMTPIAPTVYELFLTVLTLIKTYKILSNMPGCETPSLVGALISLGNLVSWHFLPSSLMSLFLYLYWSLLSSCIARLVLNLRRTYYTSSSLMTEMDNNNNNVVSANITMTNADMGLGLGSRLSQTKTKEERGKKSSRAKTNSSRHELSTRTRRFFLGDGDLGAVDAGGADASATTTLATNGAGGSGYANNQEEEEEEEAENGRRDGDEDDDDVELGRSILHHDSVPLQTLAFGRRRASGEQERIRLPPSTTGYRTNLASLDAIGDIK